VRALADLDTIRKTVAIGVGFCWICPIELEVIAIAQPIGIGIGAVGIGPIEANFLSTAEPILIRIHRPRLATSLFLGVDWAGPSLAGLQT